MRVSSGHLGHIKGSQTLIELDQKTPTSLLKALLVIAKLYLNHVLISKYSRNIAESSPVSEYVANISDVDTFNHEALLRMENIWHLNSNFYIYDKR
jgi:hypothetical protein